MVVFVVLMVELDLVSSIRLWGILADACSPWTRLDAALVIPQFVCSVTFALPRVLCLDAMCGVTGTTVVMFEFLFRSIMC